MTTVTIDIENRSGTKQGSGPIRSAVDVTLERGVSTAGVFNFLMPASDPNAANLANKTSVLRFYFDTTMVFLGVVEAMQRRIGNDGVVWLEVAGRDLMGTEFSEIPAGIDDLNNSQIAPYLIRPDGVNPDGTTTGPTWGIKYYSGGWVTYAAGALTTAQIYGKMWGENCLSAFVKIADRTNEQFVYYPETDGDRFVRWIGTRWDDSGVRAIQGAGEPVQAETNDNICFIQSLSKTLEAHELVSALYAYGAGNANARLSLAAATATPSGYTMTTASSLISNDAAVTAYGWYTKRLEFKEIGPLSNTDADLQNAANYLARAAAAWLDRNSSEQTYYDLVVTKLPAAVKPGTQIRVVYTDDSLNVDTLFNVIGIETRMDKSGAILYRLQISDTSQWALTGPGVVASTVERGEIYTAHPQMNANVTVFSYAAVPFDDTKKAELFFTLSNSIVQTNQVMMYYRVDPLRSTVSGLSGTTIGSEFSHTHTVDMTAHQHTFSIIDNGGSLTYNVGYGAGGFAGGLRHDNSGAGDDTIPTSATTGTTSQTSAAGASHTHAFTPALTYGLFEDSGGTVEVTSGVTLAVNLTSPPTATPAAISGGWYEIDLTDDLINTTTFRPSAEVNTVTITASSGKQGQVTAHIEIRAVIQAIAYT